MSERTGYGTKVPKLNSLKVSTMSSYTGHTHLIPTLNPHKVSRLSAFPSGSVNMAQWPIDLSVCNPHKDPSSSGDVWIRADVLQCSIEKLILKPISKHSAGHNV